MPFPLLYRLRATVCHGAIASFFRRLIVAKLATVLSVLVCWLSCCGLHSYSYAASDSQSGTGARSALRAIPVVLGPQVATVAMRRPSSSLLTPPAIPMHRTTRWPTAAAAGSGGQGGNGDANLNPNASGGNGGNGAAGAAAHANATSNPGAETGTTLSAYANCYRGQRWRCRIRRNKRRLGERLEWLVWVASAATLVPRQMQSRQVRTGFPRTASRTVALAVAPALLAPGRAQSAAAPPQWPLARALQLVRSRWNPQLTVGRRQWW